MTQQPYDYIVVGAGSAGVAVEFRPWATAGIAPALPGLLDAVFVSRARLDSWLEAVPAARHRFVLGLGSGAAQPPEGYRDYLAEAQAIPVAHTMSGKGGVPCTHALSAGLFGRFRAEKV